MSVISAAFIAFYNLNQYCCCPNFKLTYGKILFVGEDQEKSVTKLIFVEHAL